MKHNLLALFVLLFFFAQPTFAQNTIKGQLVKTINDGRFQSLNQDNIDLITSYPFEGNFAVLLVTDERSNYFLLDLSLLNGEFENKYFVNEVYKNNLFIQHGHGMPVSKAWVIMDITILPENGIAMLTNILANVKSVSAGMSQIDKNAWLTSPTK
jgi:hypothetical protein